MGIPELPSVSKIVCTIIVGAIPKLVVLVSVSILNKLDVALHCYICRFYQRSWLLR